MTDQHPLTDEVIHRELLPKYCYTENDLRLAADRQLEQVIEWLKSNTFDYVCVDYDLTYMLMDSFLDDLKKAVRPTTTQEDNQ